MAAAGRQRVVRLAAQAERTALRGLGGQRCLHVAAVRARDRVATPPGRAIACPACGMEEVRMWALDMLKKAKENESKMATDRRKKFPFRKWVMMSNVGFFNENADHYTNLVNWDELPGKFFGVPPLLSDYSLEELENFATNGSLDIQIPCHAQSVERMVGITSRSALIAVGQEARHAWILNSQEATKALPITKGFIPKSKFIRKN